MALEAYSNGHGDSERRQIYRLRSNARKCRTAGEAAQTDINTRRATERNAVDILGSALDAVRHKKWPQRGGTTLASARLGYSPHLFEDRLHLALADRAVEGSVVPLILVGISH